MERGDQRNRYLRHSVAVREASQVGHLYMEVAGKPQKHLAFGPKEKKNQFRSLQSEASTIVNSGCSLMVEFGGRQRWSSLEDPDRTVVNILGNKSG